VSGSDLPLVEDLVGAIGRGEVVAVPTDTVYGLAADPRQEDAAARLFAVKRRPESVALPVLVASVADGLDLAAPVARPRLALLARRYWPGALTVVVERSAGATLHLGGDSRTVGLRCPAHPLVRELCARVGPLAVTSANLHGDASCRSAAEVREVFGEEIAVLDGGPCAGTPSSVVSLVDGEVRLLRAGPVRLEDVVATLEQSPASR
jgi:tRNA threonylcarbamoyl adenosine modification protein (Sua5/YciO/YrdC/YwlC family)